MTRESSTWQDKFKIIEFRWEQNKFPVFDSIRRTQLEPRCAQGNFLWQAVNSLLLGCSKILNSPSTQENYVISHKVPAGTIAWSRYRSRQKYTLSFQSRPIKTNLKFFVCIPWNINVWRFSSVYLFGGGSVLSQIVSQVNYKEGRFSIFSCRDL